MIRLPDWLSPKSRRLTSLNEADEPDGVRPQAEARTGFARAMNSGSSVIDLVRPHLSSPECLIVTGYQDFFSSLSIIMREVPDIALQEGRSIRISFGVNTGNADGLAGRGKSIPDAVRLHFLSRQGLAVEDAADLGAVLAIEAIRTGKMDLRIFDPTKGAKMLGVSGDRRLHAKIVSSQYGALAGSANFSRSGLYQNIEYVDAAEAAHDDPTTAAVAKDRQTAAEEIWQASTDWNAEALEILEALLRPVSTADAVARTIYEQTSFSPWRIDAMEDVAGRRPLPHQAELTYEASSIAYEHGFAFVEAPTGSGKTDIGKHLGQTLGASFERIFGQDHTGRLPRGGALAIVPPRVYPSWSTRKPRVLDVVRNTTIASRRDMTIPSLDTQPSGFSIGMDSDDGSSGSDASVDLTHYGALIIDESHTVSPGFDESSKKAEAIEFAPPSWNVCLSATLLGNRDVDWLAHLHEKRASIFMSPAYLEAMNSLFEREVDIDELMMGERDVEALSAEARAALADMLSPFMAIRQRACIGENSKRDGKAVSYPPFKIHPRPKSLSLSDRQRGVMGEITSLADKLAPGRRLTSVTTSRFGVRAERRHNQNSLYARNLLNVLRVNSAQALWEMQHGAIGKALRRFEQEQAVKDGVQAVTHDAQLSFFPSELPQNPKKSLTPTCDRIVELIGRPDIQRLDERRYAAAQKIQQKHDRVVFLAERIDTLEIFAAHLARLQGEETDASVDAGQGDDHRQYLAASDVGANAKAGRRARIDILGDDEPGFDAIRQGHQIEQFFRTGGKKATDKRASVFLTYQMAEGINLQSADALVLLGVTSNLKDLLQGLGRIDRIDSPHSRIHYYLIDVPVAAIASDEKVSRRLENYRTLSGRERIERAEEAEGETQIILDSVGDYLKEERALRNGNYHDILRAARDQLDMSRYNEIARAAPQGTWGADIAVLEGAQAYTLLHLRGEDGPRNAFAPPRLLLVEPDGTLVRNQVACAQRLRAGFEETIAQGIATMPPDRARMQGALIELATRVGDIREWQLAPERTDSLLQSLSVFLSRDRDGVLNTEGLITEGVELEEALFGDLSLRGVEYLAETWARLLDPYWVRAKQQVRENFATNSAQSYISIADMTDQLQDDAHNRDRIRDLMLDALGEARRIEEPAPDAVARRISVAFISLKASLH